MSVGGAPIKKMGVCTQKYKTLLMSDDERDEPLSIRRMTPMFGMVHPPIRKEDDIPTTDEDPALPAIKPSPPSSTSTTKKTTSGAELLLALGVLGTVVAAALVLKPTSSASADDGASSVVRAVLDDFPN